MNLRKIHGFFVPGKVPLAIMILVFVFSRVLNAEEKTALELGGLIALQIGIAFALLYLNQTFIIVRNRNLLPVFFYLLFAGVQPFFLFTWTSGIASVSILLFLFLLFSSSRSYPQGNAFNIGLILTLGSFVWSPLLFFFPVLWVGMLRFHNLNFRSFFAGLTGFIVVYLFIFAGSIYLNDNLELFTAKLPDFQMLFQFRIAEEFTLQEYIVIGFLFILYIIAGANIFMWNISENTKTIVALGFLYIVTFLAFAILLLQSQRQDEWVFILYLPLSLLVSHLFSKPYGRAIIWLMLFVIVFFLAMPFREFLPDIPYLEDK